MGAVLAVFLGGGLGAVSRYGVNLAALRLVGATLPAGTLIVNVVGAFAMGIVWAYIATHLEDSLPLEVRLLIETGFLGGFTTFSAFSLDAMHLWQRGDQWLAIGYIGLSVFLSLTALAAGQMAVRAAVL